jgi:hypothetical protein
LNRFACLGACLVAVLYGEGCRTGTGILYSSGLPEISAADGGFTVTGGPQDYSLDFGKVAVGGQASAALVLSNTGSSALSVLSVGAPGDPEFDTDLASGTIVEAGTGVTFHCGFKPFSPGAKAASIQVTTDSSTTPTLTINLAGEGVPVTLQVSPTTLDFGTVVIHSSLSRSVTLTNLSALSLTVTESAIAGKSASLFGSVSTGSMMLAAHQSVAVEFTYQPQIPSAQDTARVTFTPDTGATLVLPLQGAAVETGLLITPNPIDFNYVQVGDTATVNLHVRNVGNQTVELTQAVATNSAGGVFSASLGQATSLAPSAELEIPVQFSPTQLQPYQGEISLTSNDNLGEQLVELQGWGGGAAIRCTPAAIDFGVVAVGISPTLPLICTNIGTNVPNHPEAALTIGQLPTSNAAFSASIDPSAPTVLVAGESTLIDVSYLPLGAAADSATLTIESNVRPAPVIQLTGSGLPVGPCAYTLRPASLDWGAVSAADKSLRRVQGFTISNVGTDVCVVNALRLSNDDTWAFALPQGPVASQLLAPPGMPQTTDGGLLPSSMTVPVSFAALRGAGSYAGQAIFTISDPSGPNQIVDLSAQAVDSCFFLSPDRLDLGAAGLVNGSFCQSNRRQLVGINNCPGDVTITGVQLEGSAFDERQGPAIPVVVPPGGTSPPFVVGFVPQAAGDDYGELDVQTDLLRSPLGATLHGQAIDGSDQTDVFQGATGSAVDILWVVDSDDLSTELTSLSAPPNPLDPIAQFVAAGQGIDYQMGMLTDDCPNLDDGNLEPCPNCVTTGNSANIITPSNANPGTALTDLISKLTTLGGTGYCNGNYNATMAAAWSALQPNILSGHNAGFLRDWASLAVIIYDPDGYAEDEGSPQQTSYYLDFFKSLKGGDASRVSVSVLYLGIFGPFQPEPRYSALTNASGGVMVDTGAIGWTNEIQKIWATVTNGASNGAFVLSGTPIPSTIQVWLDGPPPGPDVTMPGLSVPQTNSNGSWNWIYQPAKNSLAFNPQNFTLGPADTVTVVYQLTCG